MAGTMVVSSDKLIGAQSGEADLRVLDITCTHHTDNSFSVASTAITGLVHDDAAANFLQGWRIETVEAVPDGTTAPTDGTDLTIKDDTIALDILDGNGTDLIDATTATGTYCAIDGQPYAWPVSGTLTFATANNAVASAIFTLRLNCIRARG